MITMLICITSNISFTLQSTAFSLTGPIDVKAINSFNSENIFESPEVLMILEKKESNDENNNNHVEESGKHEIFNDQAAGWLERKRVSAPSGVQRSMSSLLRHPTTINSSNGSSNSSSNARHTKNMLNTCSSKEDEGVTFNTNTCDGIHTTSFNQNQPAALMMPKIVSGGKISALSGKQLPARKVPMNAILPTNSSLTSSRAPLSSGIEHTVGIRGGIGTGTGTGTGSGTGIGIGIEGGAGGGGGGGRVQGKSIGMGTGVLMRNFCHSSSDVSRAVEGLPRQHEVRAPKMPLQSSYNSINSSNRSNSHNINNNHNERTDVVNSLQSNSLHSLPAAITRPPTFRTSTLPVPSIVPVPVLPTAADPKGNVRASDEHSASSFLQIDSDEDW